MRFNISNYICFSKRNPRKIFHFFFCINHNFLLRDIIYIQVKINIFQIKSIDVYFNILYINCSMNRMEINGINAF